MKKKFSQLEKEQNLQKKDNKIKGIYAWCVIVVVFLVGAGLFFNSYSIFNKEVEVATKTDNEDLGVVSGVETDQGGNQYQAPPVNMSPEQKAQAEIRDQKRVEDIKRLNIAMAQYYKDNESYPDELVKLTPKYIDMIPGNPVPGGINYSYTGIGTEPYKFYDLAYVLEVGTEGIDPGMHYATPNGIAQP